MDDMVTPGLGDGPTCRSQYHHGGATPPPLAAGLCVCVGCRDRLEEDLIELPGWYELCAHVLDLRRPHLEERVNGSRPRGIVLRDAVVSVRADILGVLASWCGLVVGERRVSGPEELSIRKLTTFLAIHLTWLLAHPAAPDVVDELAALVQSARDVELPDEGVRFELGRCARPGCGELVRAENAPSARVACAAGHVVPPDEWLLLRGRSAAQRRGPGAPSASSEAE